MRWHDHQALRTMAPEILAHIRGVARAEGVCFGAAAQPFLVRAAQRERR